jgi:hypothetical protein
MLQVRVAFAAISIGTEYWQSYLSVKNINGKIGIP